MSFTNEGCEYYDENGDEIVHGYSLHKGYATQIRFRKKFYETQKGEVQKLLEAANKCGRFAGFHTYAKQLLVVGGRVERYSLANPGKTTGIVELIDLNSGKSKVLQFIESGAAPIVIRDDNKDIFSIGGFYATETMGDTRWHSQITRLNILREDVD